MKNILIVGYGNMGKRYGAILKWLNHPFFICDVDQAWYPVAKEVEASHVIFTTPTECHMDHIKELHSRQVDMKCLIEKPFWTETYCDKQYKRNSELLKDLPNVYMVNNYAYVPGVQDSTGETIYDHYNSGPHGLSYDCIQLLYLANDLDRTKLRNTSPVWKCIINGVRLTLEDVQMSYIEMLLDFLGESKNGWGMLAAQRAHARIKEYESKMYLLHEARCRETQNGYGSSGRNDSNLCRTIFI